MKTLLNIKTDMDVKQEAQKTAHDLGVPLSTVVNALLKDFIRVKKLELSLTPHLSPKLESEINRAVQDYKKRKNVSPVFDTAENAIRYLHSR